MKNFLIDYKSRLSIFECIVLYLAQKNGTFNFDDFEKFRITQTLVERYNNFINKVIDKISSDPEKYDKIIDWDAERPKTKYYLDKMIKSHEFEVYIENLFKNNGILMGYFSGNEQYAGETKIGVEIKNDERMMKTGNIYIEYMERMNPNSEWNKSGILKNDNSIFWIIGTKERYFVIEKSKLIEIYNKLINNVSVPGCEFRSEKAHGTSKGFIIKNDVIPLIIFANNVQEFVDKLKTIYKKIYFGE